MRECLNHPRHKHAQTPNQSKSLFLHGLAAAGLAVFILDPHGSHEPTHTKSHHSRSRYAPTTICLFLSVTRSHSSHFLFSYSESQRGLGSGWLECWIAANTTPRTSPLFLQRAINTSWTHPYLDQQDICLPQIFCLPDPEKCQYAMDAYAPRLRAVPPAPEKYLTPQP